MDIKKPQLVKVEAFADFFSVRHTGTHSRRKFRENESSATPPSKVTRHNRSTVRLLRRAKGALLLFVENTGSDMPGSSATPPVPAG